jgi:hypothetical protein
MTISSVFSSRLLPPLCQATLHQRSGTVQRSAGTYLRLSNAFHGRIPEPRLGALRRRA